MARYIPGAMTGPLVGSLGSDTFSKNRYGFYVKKKPIPTNPNTPAQAEVRAHMRNLVNYWKLTLTATEADAWRHAASLHSRSKYGASFNISGINLFCGLNVLRLLTGIGIIDEPTIFNGSPPVVIPTITAAASGKMEISDWNEPDTANMIAFVYCTNAVAPTISYKNSAYVFRTSFMADAVFPLLLDVAYPGSGQNYNIFVGVKIMDARGALAEIIHTNYTGTIA